MNEIERKTKPKPIIRIESAINWYFGNYLMNPNNALREEEDYPSKAYERLEEWKRELSGQMMSHSQFLYLVKENGIHDEYYRYQKPKPTDCPICRALGIKHRY